MVRTHWKPDGRSKNLAWTRCERSKDVVRKQNDLVNLKWFHFDHVLSTSFDFCKITNSQIIPQNNWWIPRLFFLHKITHFWNFQKIYTRSQRCNHSTIKSFLEGFATVNGDKRMKKTWYPPWYPPVTITILGYFVILRKIRGKNIQKYYHVYKAMVVLQNCNIILGIPSKSTLKNKNQTLMLIIV